MVKTIILLICMILLTSCAQLKKIGKRDPVIISLPVYTWADQYVVTAEADFCKWSPGIASCDIILKGQSFRVEQSGELKLLDASPKEPSEPVQYDPQNDLCKTIFKGFTCSPNFFVKAYNEPNDPFYSQQWAHKRNNSKIAWIKGISSSARIAILDSGIDCGHPDIACAAEYNAITRTGGAGSAADDNGHGTHVAGITCGTGNNSFGIVGTLWNCDLIAIKFLGRGGGGSIFDAIEGINFAISAGAKIINASWGGGGYSKPLEDAIKKANSAGVLFIAAAGNDGTDNDLIPHYPSNIDAANVIAVASINNKGLLSSFSNYGSKTVHIAAPGEKILSAYPGGGFAELSGTSMAAPFVTGIAAALLETNPQLTPAELKSLILSNASPIEDLKVVSRGETNFGKFFSDAPECDRKKLKNCIAKQCFGFACDYKSNRKCRNQCRKKSNCKELKSC